MNEPGRRQHDQVPSPVDLTFALAQSRDRLDTLHQIALRQNQVQNLAHYLDHSLLMVVGSRLRLKASQGVDQVRPLWYRQNLDFLSIQLLKEVMTDTYQPRPARRVRIPKDDGTERLLGLPCCRDKHLQGAVRSILEVIYEPQFYQHSYGFRSGRSAKNAIHALLHWLKAHNGGWILEVDLSKFFDTISHKQLLGVVRQRIADKRIISLVQAWLSAGVMDNGVLIPSLVGTPQGGVISPMLANIFLDHVLDQWIIETYLPKLNGDGFLVRYADDFILVFTEEEECHQAYAAVQARLEEYQLKVNTQKSKVIDFRMPGVTSPGKGEEAEVQFLGFTLYWKSCPVTGWKLAARTSEKSLKRFHSRLALRLGMAEEEGYTPLKLKQETRSMIEGHSNYFAIEGNEELATATSMVRQELIRRGLDSALLEVDPVNPSSAEMHPSS